MRFFLIITFLSLKVIASELILQNSYDESIQKTQTHHEIELLNTTFYKAKSYFHLCQQEIRSKYYPINCYKLNLLSLEAGWKNKFTKPEFTNYLNTYCRNKAQYLKAKAEYLINMNISCKDKIAHQSEVNQYKKEFEW